MELRLVSPKQSAHKPGLVQKPEDARGVHTHPTFGLRPGDLAGGHTDKGPDFASGIAEKRVSGAASPQRKKPSYPQVIYLNPGDSAGYTKDELVQSVLPNVMKLLLEPGNPRRWGDLTLSELENGSRAQVYKLSCPGKTDVALKIQHQKSAEPEQDRCFIECINEGKCLENIQQIPGVIGLYSYGVYTSRSWMMMELGKGDWYSRLAHLNWQCSKDEFLALAIPLLETVSHLHRQGILHRDIKPENIIDCGDFSRLSDFGASVCTHDSVFDEPYSCVGTADFQPPEALGYQWYRKREAIIRWSEKTDAWSIGRVLLESLGVSESNDCLASWDADFNRYDTMSLEQLYAIYKDRTCDGKPVHQWVEQLTGNTFEQYMQTDFPMPLANFNDPDSWRARCMLMALACHRENPAHRPSAMEMSRWLSTDSTL